MVRIINTITFRLIQLFTGALMTKKIVALCALLSINSFVSANSYPAEQGYQAPNESHHGHHYGDHHHNHSDKIADEADKRKLKQLDEQDADANSYIKFSRIGLTTGVVVAVAAGWAKKRNVVLTGLALGVGSVGVGYYNHQGNKERAKERKEILERRAKNNHSH